jgi:hypothetical protein
MRMRLSVTLYVHCLSCLAEGPNSVLGKRTGHKKLKITVVLSVLANGRVQTPFVILKNKNPLTEKLMVK